MKIAAGNLIFESQTLPDIEISIDDEGDIHLQSTDNNIIIHQSILDDVLTALILLKGN